MKIQDFYAKILESQGTTFQAFRKLQDIDTQQLRSDEGSSANWNPWNAAFDLDDACAVEA